MVFYFLKVSSNFQAETAFVGEKELRRFRMSKWDKDIIQKHICILQLV